MSIQSMLLSNNLLKSDFLFDNLNISYSTKKTKLWIILEIALRAGLIDQDV